MNKLISLMEKIKNPGTFSLSGQLPAIPSGLKVKGLGTVAFPLIEHQAKALIKLSEQAPYGRGEETIVDTTVRNVWQISSENFEITNPEWQASLQESIQQKMVNPLGLHGCKIRCEPYKLLIYEKGSFFTQHRDTEKIPNMFATLVINLPSEHEGGELIISHADQSQHYSFEKNDGLHPDFAVFYADCYHEVKPITAGYRICLIYNLAIANRTKQPLLSEQLKAVDEVHDYIQTWSRENNENPVLTYLLEHSYSEENLNLSNLKNDFAKASVLLDAAEKNGCQAFLCLVTYYRESYGETPYYGRRSRRYYDDDDDELDEEDFEEYDVSSEEIYAHGLITSNNTKVKIQKIKLEEDQLLAKVPLLEGPGRDVSISEATGNEGATKELWYHRGAVIIWPKKRHFDVVSQMDINDQIEFLRKFLKENDLSEADDRQKITRLADHIITHQRSFGSEDISQELIAIGNIELLKKLIQKQMNPHHFARINHKAFVQIAERFGWNHFKADTDTYLASKRNAIEWINTLLHLQEKLSDEGQSVLKGWMSSLWKVALERNLEKTTIDHLLQNVALLKMEGLTDQVIDFLSKQNQPLFLTMKYGPAVVSAREALKGHDYDRTIVKKFADHLIKRIQKEFPAPPEKPKDWSCEGRLHCVCEFCTQINQFLPDPKQREISFYKTLKKNITHIETEVEKSQVDLDVKLERDPPKFLGICIKNQKGYKNRLKLFEDAQKIVKKLQDAVK